MVHFAGYFPHRHSQLDLSSFIKEVRRACRCYSNDTALSSLLIAKVAADIIYRTDGAYSDEEIIAYTRGDGSNYGYYRAHYYREVSYRERERITRIIALRRTIDLCLQRVIIFRYHGMDDLTIECLLAYFAPIQPKHVVRLSRREYYRLLRRGFTFLSYHLAAYFAPYDERFIDIADALRPVEEALSPIRVSPKEQAVLQLAAQGKSDTKSLAKHLGVTTSTVETYWKRIRRKLGVRNRTEAIATAHRQGIITTR